MPPTEYDVDFELLHAQYKKLQKIIHPDRFSSKGEEERGFAADHAAAVNESYSVLKDPLQRAIYMLAERGVEYGNEGETITDSELLSEVMESRFAVEEAEGDVSELKALASANDAQRKEVMVGLAEAFLSGGLDDALRHTTRLTYLQKIQEEVATRLPAS
jgi:molecular chaperone HscB